MRTQIPKMDGAAMFEQSMVVSQNAVMPARARWTWVGSVLLQSTVASLLVVVPMLRPDRMTWAGIPASKAYLPLKVVKAPPVRVQAASSASSSVVAQAAVAAPRQMLAPRQIPREVAMGDAPPVAISGFAGAMICDMPAAIKMGGPGPMPVAAVSPPAVRGPVRISSGVAAGMLVAPIRPVYPAIARAAHVEGTVVVEAVISATGRIERARVVSGPAMLAQAALDAVGAARYTPYRLNGSATEVETAITVNFRMGG